MAEPGPNNTVQYGPHSQEAYFKMLELKREMSINDRYNEANTKKFKKILIEEEKEDLYSNNISGVKSRGEVSFDNSVIRIDENDDKSFLELERSKEMRDREKNGLFAKSRNKLIYLFKEELYKLAYEDEEKKGSLKKVENEQFSELLFFQDDRLNLALRYIAKENNQYYRHKVSLNIWYYLEAFVLHVLQMGFLGPLVFVVSLFHWPYFVFFRNMNFFNWGSLSFYIPLVFWVVNITVLLGHFLLEYRALDIGFILMMFTMLVVRSSIISSKYATFTPQYKERYKCKILGEREKKSWHMIKYWAECDPVFIEEQVEVAIRRKFIDKSTFKINFFDFCSQDVHYELKKPKNGHSYQKLSVNEGHTEFITYAGVYIYYDCKSIVYNLIKRHFIERQNFMIMASFFFLSLFWVLFPVFGRYETNLTLFGDTPGEITIFILGMIICFFYFLLAILFFRQAYMDLDRQRYMLRQLSQMISPMKLPDIKEKLYPTINIVDIVSLQAWANLRKVIFDYGINFQNRHKIYLLMCFTIASASGFVVIFSEMIFPRKTRDEIFRLQCPLAISYLVFGLKFLILTRISYLINENGDRHIEILRDTQQIFYSFVHFKDFYIGANKKNAYKQKTKKKQDRFDAIPYDVKKIFEKVSTSREHQWINFKIRMMVGQNYEESNEYLKKLVTVIDEIVKGIEFHQRYHCSTVLGVKTSASMVGACVFWYSIIGFYGWLASFYLRFD